MSDTGVRQTGNTVTKDDAGWHYDSVSDLGLDLSAAAIHIGAFLAWAANQGLVKSSHQKAMVAAYRRNVTLSEYAYTYFSGEFSNSDLTATGVAFADASYRAYLGSISAVPALARYDSTYEIPDTWETYDALSVLLDELFAYWKSGREFYP